MFLTGCGHASTVQDRFAADYDCRKVKVRRTAGTTYVAQGCGYSATYTCATGDDGWGHREHVCVREADPRPQRTLVQSREPKRQPATVERKYDEKRKLEKVVGTFTPAPNVTVVLAGAPGASLGEVSVELRMPRYLMKSECTSLEVLVNGVPSAGAQLSTSNKNAIYAVQARYDFQTFKPLAQQFSTLGARGCGYEAKLDEHAMNDVKKFFVIYSQIAAQIAGPAETVPATDKEL
jgi:hypothetical protein